ncbi:YhhN-like [Trinorchestia longiramus]|nr:YhhN-like [Trinorchestia longiramus]
MTTLTQVLKSGVGPKLVPFFKTVAIYFVVFIPQDQHSVLRAILKALPVLSLVAFVLLHGMSFGDEYFYSRRILLGLLCSVVGDVLLVWDHLFLHGLGAFLVAQICYISAFGFKPLNLPAATVFYSLLAISLSFIVPPTEGALSIGVSVYSTVLATMVWRSVARVQLFEELWTWTKLCSCAGGIFFAFSDACIGIHHFYKPIPHSEVIIMGTYYAAQLGISLSVVDCKASYLDSLKKTAVHVTVDSEQTEPAQENSEPVVLDDLPTNTSAENSSANYYLQKVGGEEMHFDSADTQDYVSKRQELNNKTVDRMDAAVKAPADDYIDATLFCKQVVHSGEPSLRRSLSCTFLDAEAHDGSNLGDGKAVNGESGGARLSQSKEVQLPGKIMPLKTCFYKTTSHKVSTGSSLVCDSLALNC